MAGYVIKGGLIYLGRNLPAVNQGGIEPALIDPSQRIQRSGANCQLRMLDYWPRYESASVGARASYLEWHAGGRKDPLADIGHVFLYFYGLERRALFDAIDDPVAQAEIPQIEAEVRRLKSLYADSRSFSKYAAAFLEYLETGRAAKTGLPEIGQLPALERGNLSFELRRQLGAFAGAAKPLPMDWAYVWFHNDPRTQSSAALERCPAQMASLFRAEYQQQFGAGIALPQNKSQLKLTYKPASPSFGVLLSESLNLPDVSVLSAPYAKIEALALACASQLDLYSRFLSRNPDQGNGFDALMLLPASLWPDHVMAALGGLRESAKKRGGARVLKLEELLEIFGQSAALTKSRYGALAKALEDAGLAIEPDARFGGLFPTPNNLIALYPRAIPELATANFALAALILQLAAFVACSDGDLSEREAAALGVQIESRMGLAAAERRRLLARLAIYRRSPPPLTGLKKVIEGLGTGDRTNLVDFLITVVHADGHVSPGEVRALEKIFALFELERGALYTKLHELAAGPVAKEAAAELSGGPIKLDMIKIEKLKAASAQVAERLKVIYDSDPESAPAPGMEATAQDGLPAAPPATLLGLDSAHSDLLAVLSGRSHWTRAEFEELCQDKGLLPDGAIERINEAAFDKFDQAIIEGDDPLEVLSQLLTEEKAA